MRNDGATADDLKLRTKLLALRIIKLVRSLPRDTASVEMGRQIVRSGMSVAANYRAACRGRSTAEFIAKLGIAEEEADETALWLELLIESDTLRKPKVEPLLDEANQIVAITVASIRTARKRPK